MVNSSRSQALDGVSTRVCKYKIALGGRGGMLLVRKPCLRGDAPTWVELPVGWQYEGVQRGTMFRGTSLEGQCSEEQCFRGS